MLEYLWTRAKSLVWCCLSKVYHSQRKWVFTLWYWWMSKSTHVNENGFKHFAHVGCQFQPQSTRMCVHLLLMVNAKVYHSQREWIQTLFLCWVLKSTTINENWCSPFANGGCESLLKTSRIGLQFLVWKSLYAVRMTINE